jgi:hypothetical protein
MKPLISLLYLLMTFLPLTSCVATWGSSYEVVHSNSEGMLIQYDPVLVSPATIANVAQSEATKYGRVIVPGSHEKSHYLGIHQRYYKFIKPSSQGRTIY